MQISALVTLHQSSACKERYSKIFIGCSRSGNHRNGKIWLVLCPFATWRELVSSRNYAQISLFLEIWSIWIYSHSASETLYFRTLSLRKHFYKPHPPNTMNICKETISNKHKPNGTSRSNPRLNASFPRSDPNFYFAETMSIAGLRKP